MGRYLLGLRPLLVVALGAVGLKRQPPPGLRAGGGWNLLRLLSVDPATARWR
ncbi:MAG: hypothetical protein HYZ50_14925 [Deltaproteobacteria bacterium]|nr:hypothetical protein [Deltaproteobacteria bacterium]